MFIHLFLKLLKKLGSYFDNIGKKVEVIPSEKKDEVQKDARNEPDSFIRKIWQPKTSVKDGLKKVFEVMKNDWV